MNVEEVREHCIAKKGVTESFPFDETSLVVKVLDKMFGIISLNGTHSMNLKCDPDRAVELREAYSDAIIPGFHMNKKHWNTIQLDQNLSRDLLLELIDHSYDLVVAKLTKKQKDILNNI